MKSVQLRGAKIFSFFLRSDMQLRDKDFQFLKEYPEHALWLEQHTEPRMWSKFKLDKAEREENQLVKEEMKWAGCTEMWDCECILRSSL